MGYTGIAEQCGDRIQNPRPNEKGKRMSLHTFNPEIAKQVGVNAAVIYQNIIFWTEKNVANNRNVHDDYVYCYNSIEAWGKLIPYLSASQIRTAIKHLVEAKLIVETNLNEKKYDRTKWYGVPLEAFCEKSQFHLSNFANGFVKNRKPIPDSKPDSNPDNNNTSSNDDGDMTLFELNYWNYYPRKVGKKAAFKAWKRHIKGKQEGKVMLAYYDFVDQLKGKEEQFIPHLATWINGERWNDGA